MRITLLKRLFESLSLPLVLDFPVTINILTITSLLIKTGGLHRTQIPVLAHTSTIVVTMALFKKPQTFLH